MLCLNYSAQSGRKNSGFYLTYPFTVPFPVPVSICPFLQSRARKCQRKDHGSLPVTQELPEPNCRIKAFEWGQNESEIPRVRRTWMTCIQKEKKHSLSNNCRAWKAHNQREPLSGFCLESLLLHSWLLSQETLTNLDFWAASVFLSYTTVTQSLS